MCVQTHPDIVFDVCELSSILSQAKVDDLLRANKIVKKFRNTSVVFEVSCIKRHKKQLKVESFDDVSFDNLPDGGS